MSDVIDQTQLLLKRLEQMHRPKATPLYKETALQTPKINSANKISATEIIAEVENQSPLPEPIYELENQTIPFELWEALAYDLALDNVDEVNICQEYNIGYDNLQAFKQNRYFAKMLLAKQEEIKQLGSDAGFTVKFRMISNKGTAQFLKRLTDPGTPTKEFHALFKTAVELGQLKPQEESEQPMPVLGTAITFNIQGVPGLDHLATSQTLEGEFKDITSDELREL